MNRRVAMTLAALAGCAWGEPLAPELSEVIPPVVANDQDSILVIRGAGFVPAVTVDFDEPSRSRVSSAFRAELRRGGPPVLLADVTVVSPTDLRGRFPADTPPGSWDVVVIAPDGEEVTLAAGLKVSLTTCGDVPAGGVCDDRNPCTGPDTCQGNTCVSGPAVTDGTPCAVTCIDRSIAGSCTSGVCLTGVAGC